MSKTLFERDLLTDLEDLHAALEGDRAASAISVLPGKSGFEEVLLSLLSDVATAAKKITKTYYFSGVDFGAGDSTQVVAGPTGLRGRVRDVTVYNVTETFTDDTTEARVDIGDGTDADEFGKTADFGTLAANASDSFDVSDGDDEIIAANQDVTLTFVAPTGGTPAGIADVAVTIDWFE